MGKDHTGLYRKNCAKLGCFCHHYSGKKAEGKKEKKQRGAYYCRECLHPPSDHIVAAEGIESGGPALATPGTKLLSPVSHTPETPGTKGPVNLPTKSPEFKPQVSTSVVRNVASPASVTNSVYNSSSNTSGNSMQTNARNLDSGTNKPNTSFGNASDTVRVGMDPNRPSFRGNRGNNNRGNANRGNRGNGNRGGIGNGRGNGNQRGNMPVTNSHAPKADKFALPGGFAPRVPSMAPSAMGIQDRGNYDDSHIRDCDKVTRIGRNVGLIGPDQYALSHLQAKYYESNKKGPSPQRTNSPSQAVDFSSPGGNIVQSPGRSTSPGNFGTNRGVSRGNQGGNRGNINRGMNKTNASPRANVSPSGTKTVPIQNTSPVGDNHCSNCRQEIYGSYMVLGSHSYHKHCSSCNDCKKNVFKLPFYQLPNSHHLVCENCYNQNHCIKCSKCNRSITKNDEGIKALGKPWHKACLTCVVCNIPIYTQGEWFSIDGRPHCSLCS